MWLLRDRRALQGEKVSLVSFSELCFYFKNLCSYHLLSMCKNHYNLPGLRQESCKRKMVWGFQHLNFWQRKSLQFRTEVIWTMREIGGLETEMQPKGTVVRGGQPGHAGNFGGYMSLNNFVVTSWSCQHQCQSLQPLVVLKLHPGL